MISSLPVTYSLPLESMKSTWVSTSQKSVSAPLTGRAPGADWAGAGGRAGPALAAHHVGGEIETALEQRAADAVGIHRHAQPGEFLNLLHGESPRHHDADPVIPRSVERLAHVPDQLRTDARGPEAAHLRDHRA